MHRREMLRRTVLLSGGILASSLPSIVFAQLQASRVASKNIFKAEQKNMVATIAEHIIPTTDTPGAKQAGVAEFIEQIVADWYREDERKAFFAGLHWFAQECQTKFKHDFLQASEQQQIAMLTHAEKLSLQIKQNENFDKNYSVEVFFSEIKELTVLGYYTSEVGCTQELRYNPMPMKFQGDIPYQAGESTWSS